MSVELFNKGQDLFEEGDYDASITIFENLRKKNFELKDTYYLLAQNFLYKLLQLKKNSKSAYQNPINRNIVQEEFKLLYDKAFEYSKNSIELYDYQDSDSLFCMAEIQREQGDIKSAILNYLRASKLGDREALLRLNQIKANELGGSDLIETITHSQCLNSKSLIYN